MKPRHVFAAVVVSLAAACAQETPKVQASITQEDENYSRYTYTVSGVTRDVRLHLAIEPAYGRTLGGWLKKAKPSEKCQDPCWEGTPKAGEPALMLDAPDSEAHVESIRWTLESGETGTTLGPVRALDPQFFTLLIGAGTLITSRAATDYKVVQNTNVISATGIGRNNVDLLVGGSFNLGFAKGHRRDVPKPWSAFISLKFSPGSQNTINGFVFGGGYRITKYLDIIAGAGLTPRKEPSIGLRRAAFQAVLDNPNDPLYKSFQGIARDLLLNRFQAFDGFPLLRGGTSIYNGEVLVNHYRTGFFVGVAFPLSIKTALAGQ